LAYQADVGSLKPRGFVPPKRAAPFAFCLDGLDALTFGQSLVSGQQRKKASAWEAVVDS